MPNNASIEHINNTIKWQVMYKKEHIPNIKKKQYQYQNSHINTDNRNDQICKCLMVRAKVGYRKTPTN